MRFSLRDSKQLPGACLARPQNVCTTTLTSFVDKSRSEQGCVDYHFHVSLDDPNMFYFYENWTERADFDRHIALDYQKDWFAKQGEYLAKPVELRFFEMVSAYDK